MTDYTHYERFMTRDEIVLRLNMETALRECCESECAKLKKELEDTKASFKILLKGANANASALSLENEKLKKEIAEHQNELYSKGKQIDSLEHENMKLKDKYGELLTCHNDLKHELDICTKEIKHLREITTDDHISNLATKLNYECATKENEKLRKKVANQKTQLVDIQQALLNRNMTIEALTGENDRLKKEVKERRGVFEPTSYLIDIQTKDEEIETLRKKNLDLKNENEGLKLKYDHLNADLEKKVLDNVELNEQIEKDIQDYNKLFHEKEKLEKELETANERDTDIHIEKLKKQIAELRELNKCLNDEVNKLKNDYYGVLNKYDDLSKDYNELNDMKLKHASHTQPLYIENLNVTYYANGPIWTNEEDKNDISGSIDQN